MMKKLIFFIGIFFLTLEINTLFVQAADTTLLDELEFQEIQETVDELMDGRFEAKEVLTELTTGEFTWDLEEILEIVLGVWSYNWNVQKQMLLSVLVLAIIAALLTNFSGVFRNKQVAEVSFEMTYMVLFLILVQTFDTALSITTTALASLQEFMRAMIPAYFMTIAFATGPTTAGVFYEFMLLLIYGIGWVLENLLLIFMQIYIVLVFVNHLTKEEYLSQLTTFISDGVGWILKTMLAIVIGFNAIQGMIAPAVDAFKMTSFHKMIGMIPGVGNIAGSFSEMLLGSAVLIKNGVGVLALICIIVLCMVPLAKLGLLIFLLKGASALIEPISDKRILGCVTDISLGIALLFRMVFTVAALFLLTIVVVTVSTGGIR